MAAIMGLASSNVRVERAMKACKKARLQLLYWLSAMLTLQIVLIGTIDDSRLVYRNSRNESGGASRQKLGAT